jgi:hypothetical protein
MLKNGYWLWELVKPKAEQTQKLDANQRGSKRDLVRSAQGCGLFDVALRHFVPHGC